ncbi:MAG: Ig-like domain-containing protein [Gemmatimonadota bacterium]
MRPTFSLAPGLALAWAALLSAQQPHVLNGRVMNGMNAVPNQPVSLHQVTADGGNTLATDTTDADGRFVLTFGPAAADDGGVHFVAARYDGKLYIGDTFRNDPPPGYALRVGPGATPIELGTPQPTPNRAGLVVLVVSIIVFGSVFFFAARQRRESARQLLVEIADLDNNNERTARPNYEQERAELMRRLRESA